LCGTRLLTCVIPSYARAVLSVLKRSHRRLSLLVSRNHCRVCVCSRRERVRVCAYLLLCAPHSVTVQPPDRTSAVAVTTIVCLGNLKKTDEYAAGVFLRLRFVAIVCSFFYIWSHLCLLRRIHLYLYDECVRLVVWSYATVTVVFIPVSYF